MISEFWRDIQAPLTAARRGVVGQVADLDGPAQFLPDASRERLEVERLRDRDPAQALPAQGLEGAKIAHGLTPWASVPEATASGENDQR